MSFHTVISPYDVFHNGDENEKIHTVKFDNTYLSLKCSEKGIN